MRREYDFSNAERGKFYRKGGELRLPIYLESELQGQVERLAQRKGRDLEDVVNELVRREVELIEEFS